MTTRALLLALFWLALAPLAPAAEEDALYAELGAALRRRGACSTALSYESEAFGAAGTIALSYDPQGRRLLLERREERPRAGTSYTLFEPGRVSVWDERSARSFLADLAPLTEAVVPLASLLAELGGERVTPEELAARLGPELQLGLQAGADGRPELDLGLGTSACPGSWLRALQRSDPGRRISADEQSVRVELPGQGLSLELDRATGFFRSQTLRLAQGSFTLRAGPLQPLESFPESRPPADSPTEGLPMERFVALTQDLCFEGLRLAPGQLSDPERLRAAYTRAAAAAAHARCQHLLADYARRFVRARLEQGVSRTDLKRDLAQELEAFSRAAAAGLEGLPSEEVRLLTELRERLLARLDPASAHAKLLREALEPERVEAARAPDRPLRGYLEAALGSEVR